MVCFLCFSDLLILLRKINSNKSVFNFDRWVLLSYWSLHAWQMPSKEWILHAYARKGKFEETQNWENAIAGRKTKGILFFSGRICLPGQVLDSWTATGNFILLGFGLFDARGLLSVKNFHPGGVWDKKPPRAHKGTIGSAHKGKIEK